MNFKKFTAMTICLLALSMPASGVTDSLNVEHIDKMQLHDPDRAYRLLAPARQRLEREEFRSTSRMRYELVAGYVCLRNHRYAETLRHALALQQMGKEGDKMALLTGLELHCLLAGKLGQYEHAVRLVEDIRHETDELDEDDSKTRALKAYYTLFCQYHKVQSLSKSRHPQRALQALADARKRLATLTQDADWRTCTNCTVMRHSFDVLQADIYLDNGMNAEAVAYIERCLKALSEERRRGGDGVSTPTNYGMQQLALMLRLGLAQAHGGYEAQARTTAGQCDSMFRHYPATADAVDKLLNIYAYTGSVPAHVLASGESFYQRNHTRPSVELLNVCASLLRAYLQQGQTDKAREMFAEAKRVNDAVNRENMEFYETLTENSRLRMSNYQQRVLKYVAAGIAVVCLLILLLMAYYHRRRLRDSRYLYKYVRMATQKASAQPKGGDEEEENMVEKIERVLKEDGTYLSTDFDTVVVERGLQMRRYAITQQLADKYHTTLNEIVTDLRLQHARALLEETDYVLEYIALESGFNSVRTFYRQFKKKYNLTPTAYRKLGKLNA